ncbi:hypothetical protein KIN20_027381 [Parelaphostrongylus tenuis]|uniref:Uncharacterized protein n=1 Tax=Parelaphostrongylus tenuis TaxID=148309 RepID=A0AAD5QZ84_PARTN|nr:hypothetical protein KIN20_027381 [Parelaphostrongylus tenuis]
MGVASDTETAISFVETMEGEPQPPSPRRSQSSSRFSLLSVFNSVLKVAVSDNGDFIDFSSFTISLHPSDA